MYDLEQFWEDHGDFLLSLGEDGELHRLAEELKGLLDRRAHE